VYQQYIEEALSDQLRAQGTKLASSLKTMSQLQFWWQMQLSK